MQFIKSLYIANYFFYSILLLATCFVLSFFIPALYFISVIIFWCFLALCVAELIMLYAKKSSVELERVYPEKLSNGDENKLTIRLTSSYPTTLRARVLEEFPEQLQIRDIEFQERLERNTTKAIHYMVRPTQRGAYRFGRCHVLVRWLGLFERKFTSQTAREITCYPSFIQLRKYQLLATTDRLHTIGVKRIRRVGATMEFDHIRAYVQGDEYRHVNWKATAKHKKLYVNQFQEERSQPIYALIDTGRAMRMPFEGLTLLDYAINASLVLANAALLKQDRAGMLTFSKSVENHVAAEKRNNQMQIFSEKLYQVKTAFEETEFGGLYAFCKKYINKRSLLMMYTNFETIDALSRQMSYLKMLNRNHVLVVVIFKNTELNELNKNTSDKVIDVYNQVIAEKFIYEKQLIIQELNRQGIQTIYTEPQGLTINSINKYLEIKARGLL